MRSFFSIAILAALLLCAVVTHTAVASTTRATTTQKRTTTSTRATSKPSSRTTTTSQTTRKLTSAAATTPRPTTKVTRLTTVARTTAKAQTSQTTRATTKQATVIGATTRVFSVTSKPATVLAATTKAALSTTRSTTPRPVTTTTTQIATCLQSPVGGIPSAVLCAAEGVYEYTPKENDWHRGVLRATVDGRLMWTNDAGVSWPLLAKGTGVSGGKYVTTTDSTCPYGVSDVPLTVSGGAAGSVTEYVFMGMSYKRVAPLPAPKFPLAEAALRSVGQDWYTQTPMGREALDVFLDVTNNYQAGRVEQAAARLDALWKAYPPGTDVWWNAHDASSPDAKSIANFGFPTCYYALRIATECVDHWLRTLGKKAAGPAGFIKDSVAKYNFKILALRTSEGKMPPSPEALAAGNSDKWPTERRSLNPALLPRGSKDSKSDPADNGQATATVSHTEFGTTVPSELRTAMYWWGEYVWAITGGRLTTRVDMHWADPSYVGKFEVTQQSGRNFATTSTDGLFSQLPRNFSKDADTWFFLHPSPVPTQTSFISKKAEFVTGGMGMSPDGRPLFIADDLWILRQPYHLGSGSIGPTERLAYQPQWFQHEYFHALFNHDSLFHESNLEATSHGWFKRETWPKDFEGVMEPDYFHQALHKRFLLATVTPPLWVRMKRWPIATLNVTREIIGDWRTQQPANDWHYVTISATGKNGSLVWRNKAGVQWGLQLVLQDAQLVTGADCPYQGQNVDIIAEPILTSGVGGAVTLQGGSKVTGLRFGDLFVRA